MEKRNKLNRSCQRLLKGLAVAVVNHLPKVAALVVALVVDVAAAAAAAAVVRHVVARVAARAPAAPAAPAAVAAVVDSSVHAEAAAGGVAEAAAGGVVGAPANCNPGTTCTPCVIVGCSGNCFGGGCFGGCFGGGAFGCGATQGGQFNPDGCAGPGQFE